MRKNWILVVALCLVGSVTASATPSELSNLKAQIQHGSSTTEGRFQLFQGLITINAKGTAFTAPVVFKIDSTTGRVWKYEEGQTLDGEFYQHWILIE